MKCRLFSVANGPVNVKGHILLVKYGCGKRTISIVHGKLKNGVLKMDDGSSIWLLEEYLFELFIVSCGPFSTTDH